MNNSSLLKQVAKLIVESGKVNKTIENYVLNNLSRSELKIFLFFLKEALRKSNVTVISAGTLNADQKKQFEIFYKKSAEFIIDESIGAGVIIKNGDDVYDASFRNMISETISKLEN